MRRLLLSQLLLCSLEDLLKIQRICQDDDRQINRINKIGRQFKVDLSPTAVSNIRHGTCKAFNQVLEIKQREENGKSLIVKNTSNYKDEKNGVKNSKIHNLKLNQMKTLVLICEDKTIKSQQAKSRKIFSELNIEISATTISAISRKMHSIHQWIEEQESKLAVSKQDIKTEPKINIIANADFWEKSMQTVIKKLHDHIDQRFDAIDSRLDELVLMWK